MYQDTTIPEKILLCIQSISIYIKFRKEKGKLLKRWRDNFGRLTFPNFFYSQQIIVITHVFIWILELFSENWQKTSMVNWILLVHGNSYSNILFCIYEHCYLQKNPVYIYILNLQIFTIYMYGVFFSSCVFYSFFIGFKSEREIEIKTKLFSRLVCEHSNDNKMYIRTFFMCNNFEYLISMDYNQFYIGTLRLYVSLNLEWEWK